MKKLLSLSLILCLFTTFNAFGQYTNTKIKIGQKAPELKFPNPEGKVLTLSKINKGRYVLLDFWASWCGPCRMASPSMVKLYKKYKDKKFKGARKGFTIVSVSLDKNKESWVKAIKQDNYAWPYQMSDLKAWRSKPAAIYGVRFIPQSFLIGPKGKIIGKFQSLGAAAAAEKILDKDLKK